MVGSGMSVEKSRVVTCGFCVDGESLLALVAITVRVLVDDILLQ